VAKRCQDLNAVHDKIEKADNGFALVPISSSEVSEKLRIAHAQRVISSQLRDIIWQPFSSEITLQQPTYHSLLSRISDELAKSTHGESSGLRAARVQAALTMRGLQSQASSSTRRTVEFVDKVMAVLSLLVKPSLHTNLQKDLLDLATSAVSLWNTAQTDERELIVCPNLDPASYDGWDEDMSALNNGVIVLFPHVIARSYPRTVRHGAVGPPGMWIDSEPEFHIQETCIHRGAGLPEWSALVLEGEEEEEDRRVKRDKADVEQKKRALEEDLKNLEKPVPGHKRKMSQSRREPITGSGSSPSSPTAAWMKGGGQKIPEEAE